MNSGVKKAIRLVQDGWSNVLTGIGVLGRDKRLGANVLWNRFSERDCEHLYASDDVAARVIDLLPDTALQKSIEISRNETINPAMADDIYDYLVKEKMLLSSVCQAWKWARMYGGAGIFISADDGRKLHEPLEVGNIRKIGATPVFHAFELVPGEVENSIMSRYYGLPRFYNISPRSGVVSAETITKIHHTRIVRFEGSPLPRQLFVQNNFWGDSVLNRLYNVLRNFNLSNDAAATMMEDFNVGVIKLKDLSDLLQTEGGSEKLKARIEIMNLSKSSLKTIILDADQEEYDNLSRTLTGMPEMLRLINDRLVAATGMPHTLILGQSPTGGLSGKGESENRDWYDTVANQRENYLQPVMNRLITVLLSSKDSPTKGKIPMGFDWDFCQLWQVDEKTKIETRKIQADTDAVYLDRGVLSPSDVAKSRFGGDQYSHETNMSDEPESFEQDE